MRAVAVLTGSDLRVLLDQPPSSRARHTDFARFQPGLSDVDVARCIHQLVESQGGFAADVVLSPAEDGWTLACYSFQT